MDALARKTIVGLAQFIVCLIIFLFAPAWTLNFWQAWIYLVLFFGLSAVITRDLVRHDPALLARRMKGGPTAERRPQQRVIMLGASLGFIALLAVPALDPSILNG